MLQIDAATQRELAPFGFDPAQLARFAQRIQSGRETSHLTGAIAPLEPHDCSLLPARGTADHARLESLGQTAIARGEVGAVILAGGMATRFGGVVKALAEAFPSRTFLSLKLADLQNIPTFVMTSFATHDRIAAYLAGSRVETFAQLVSLRLVADGALFRDEHGAPSPYATGHGDLTFALRSSGVLARFRARGGKLIYMSNVDNLGATLDPAVIGAHLAGGAKISAELVRKLLGDRGGAPARVDGVPQIVEIFRFPPSFDQDTIPLFNTNSFVFDAEAIDREFDLTFFRTDKNVGDTKVVQFERLVGQLTQFLPTHFIEVPRGGPEGRFQPVKDPEELELRRAEIREILKVRLGIDLG
jgi:UTP--glucose-1-phosphate uridylyltransferase